MNGVPDYVFNDDYDLMSLSDLQQYIKKHRHLPNFKSAEEIAQDGANLGEMNKRLLEKVEELTLYILHLQQQIDSLKTGK